MPLAALLSALSLGEPSITVVTSACYAHFATPCAIQTVPAVVDEVVEALELHPGQEAGVLANVSYALFNRDYGFWPSVFNETGAYVASGRPASGDVPSGRSLQGQLLETVAAAEAGIDQVGLWDRVKQAAAGDGHFIHAALDLYADHKMENVSNAVTRVGHVRSVDTNTHGRLYVVSSFSSKPLAELAATQPCDVQYDAPCSIAYARKVLGLVATDMLRAATEGQLQQVFLAATAREYNEHGFYPFIFMTNGTNVAHGANSANLGRTLQDIVDNAASLQGLVDGSELHEEFVRNAALGGGWVGYWWRNAGEEPYLKIALIALRVSRFGRDFYVGVGFNHRRSPEANGPHCAACKQNYNYPCAWANTKGLIGHCQSLIFMSNRHSVEDAFQLLSLNPSYGGGGELNRSSDRSADWLYPFVYDLNGTCVAHGAKPSNVGKTLWEIGAAVMGVQDSRLLHEKFVAAATGEGRWVAYDWRNSGNEPVYRKLAIILRVTREGRDFYLGAGLADYDWLVHGSDLRAQGGGTSRWLWGCSVERQHPCSEDWAVTVAGRRMSSMLQATSYEELQASLRGASLRNETFGFETHIHNSTVVLWDGHDESFVGQTRGEWMSAVGLSTTDLEQEYESGGSWLGPFDMRLTRSGEIARRYVFYISLSIDDELADGVEDGVGDTYYLLVAVSGAAPMMTAAPKSLTGGAYECLQRPSVSLAPDASAMVSERIKCVTSLDEIGSDPEHCSNPDKDDVCPDSQNEWSDDAYSLDGGCHHLVQDGSWENSTVCDCEVGYARRFAARRVLGQADLPDDARCSAPAYECAPSDLNCVNRLALQDEYEQYCSLESSSASVWEPWYLALLAILIFFLCLMKLKRRPQVHFGRLYWISKQTIDPDWGGNMLVMKKPRAGKDKWDNKWHLFLSHTWAYGQDQTHNIYNMLKTMAPDLELWLDVNQEFSTGDLPEHVKQSEAFLLFLTNGYFSSEFCRQELAAAHVKEKKIIIICEADPMRGGGDLVKAASLRNEIEETKQKEQGKIQKEQLEAMDMVVDLVERNKFYPWTRTPIFQEHVLTSVVEDIVQHMGPTMVKQHMEERSSRASSQRSSDERRKPFLRSGQPKSKLKLVQPELWLHVPRAYPEDVRKQLKDAFEETADGVKVTSFEGTAGGVKVTWKREPKPSAVPGSKENPVPVLLLCDRPKFFDNKDLVNELKLCFPKSRVDQHRDGVVKQMPEILLYDLKTSFAEYRKQYAQADAKVLKELEQAPFGPKWSTWPQDPQLQKLTAEVEVRKIVAILAKWVAGGESRGANLRSVTHMVTAKYLHRWPSASVAPAVSPISQHGKPHFWQR